MSRFSILTTMPHGSDSGDSSQSVEHVLRLSSLDQASERSYLRYCVGFPCSTGDIDTVPDRLTSAVKRTVTHLPVLAGSIRPVDADTAGRVEIAVTLEQVANFKPIIKILTPAQFRHSFQDLTTAGVPQAHLINNHLTPLPDAPPMPTPVFTVQASFIAGGVIVALYLHHSVCDVFGLQTVIHHLSADLPSVGLTDDAIREDTVEQSRLRDRLSGTRGAKAVTATGSPTATASGGFLNAPTISGFDSSYDCTRVLCFNLDLIEGAHEIVNERFSEVYKDSTVHLSMFQVLSAILWKGVNRAIGRSRAPFQADGRIQTSSIAIPVNIRQRIGPPLDGDYLGNAIFHHIAEQEAYKLALPFNITRLAETGRLISGGMVSVNEDRIRRAIASINESSSIQDSPAKPFTGKDNSLTIVDQTHMRLESAHLGLGLGAPHWARKLGRDISVGQCIVHPIAKADGVWEVTVELSEHVMAALLKDEQFMVYVSHTA